MGAMQGYLPPQNSNAINQIWQQTPQVDQQKTQNGFITESPFSFKNPIFFSVPRSNGNKNVKLLKSKRQLFGAHKAEKKKQSQVKGLLPLFKP